MRAIAAVDHRDYSAIAIIKAITVVNRIAATKVIAAISRSVGSAAIKAGHGDHELLWLLSYCSYQGHCDYSVIKAIVVLNHYDHSVIAAIKAFAVTMQSLHSQR